MKTLRYAVAALAIVGVHAAKVQAQVGATSNGSLQTPAPGSNQGGKGGGKGGAIMTTAQHTPQCVHIITECKQLGFVAGQYKADNGLWRDCFDPVVMGKGTPTRDGKPITVPANPSDVQACHAAILAS